MRWKLDLLLWPRDQEIPVEACWLFQTQEGQIEQICWWSFFWQHWHDLHALGSHWTDSRQGILCWGFKGIQEEIPRGEASTLQTGSVAFHRDNAPVHNSILVTDYLTKMGINTVPHPPYSPDPSPVTFSYSLSSEAVVMRQFRRWKRLWRRSLTR